MIQEGFELFFYEQGKVPGRWGRPPSGCPQSTPRGPGRPLPALGYPALGWSGLTQKSLLYFELYYILTVFSPFKPESGFNRSRFLGVIDSIHHQCFEDCHDSFFRKGGTTGKPGVPYLLTCRERDRWCRPRRTPRRHFSLGFKMNQKNAVGQPDQTG